MEAQDGNHFGLLQAFGHNVCSLSDAIVENLDPRNPTVLILPCIANVLT